MNDIDTDERRLIVGRRGDGLPRLADGRVL
jgi:hypothetical protein